MEGRTDLSSLARGEHRLVKQHFLDLQPTYHMHAHNTLLFAEAPRLYLSHKLIRALQHPMSPIVSCTACTAAPKHPFG